MKLQETDIPKSRWQEIENNYHDESDGFYRIDAWRTTNDDEEGKVIAVIDDTSGNVYCIDKLAEIDDFAQKMITERRNAILAPATAHTN